MCHYVCGEGFTFWDFIVERSEWSSMKKKTCAKLCTMSLSTCGWPSGSIIDCSSNKFVMYVVLRITKCSNQVGL